MRGDQEENTERNSINLLSLPFTVIPLDYFADGGQLLHYLKFLVLFLVIWAPGLFVTHLSGSFSLYLTDWGHLLFDGLHCVGLLLLVSLCQEAVDAMDELDKVANHTKDKHFSGLVREWNRSSLLWYSLCILTPLAINLSGIYLNLVGLHHLHGPPPTWADYQAGYVSQETSRLNTIYWVYENLWFNIILGVGFNRFIHYLRFASEYGQNFLSKASVDLLHPSAVEELKPFQRLVIKSTFFCSLPLALLSLAFFEHLIRKQRISLWQLGCLIAVIGFFFFTLLYQMRWVRKALTRAKMDALSIIDENVDKIHTVITEDATMFLALANLFTLRDRLKKISTWGFDTGLISRFFLAILLPILGGALLQLFLEQLMMSVFS